MSDLIEKKKMTEEDIKFRYITPVIAEAKDNNHMVSHGLQQAMTCAKMMDVPFAYGSNGCGVQYSQT